MSVRPPIDRSIDYSILLSRPAPSLIPSLTWCPLAESGTTSGRADRNDAISSKARVVDKAGSEESSEEGQIQDDRNHFEKAFRVPRYFDEEVVGADGLSSDATRRHALSFLVFSLSLSSTFPTRTPDATAAVAWATLPHNAAPHPGSERAISVVSWGTRVSQVGRLHNALHRSPSLLSRSWIRRLCLPQWALL